MAVAADAESLIGDLNDPDQVPCWSDVWPAARGMAQYIWDGPELTGSTTLELGAGVGLPGVACGLKGAAVVFSDFQPLALELCAENARLNGLQDFRILLQDWRTYNCRERFDLVLASDIAYESRLLPFLKEVLLQAVKPGGIICISHDNRPVTLAFIQELLASNPFTEEKFEISVSVEDTFRPHYKIALHLLKNKEGTG